MLDTSEAEQLYESQIMYYYTKQSKQEPDILFIFPYILQIFFFEIINAQYFSNQLVFKYLFHLSSIMIVNKPT